MTTRSIALMLMLLTLPLMACGREETAATTPPDTAAVVQPAAPPLPVPAVDVPLVAITKDGQHHVVELAPGAWRVLPRPVLMVGTGELTYWTDADPQPRTMADDVDLGAWATRLYLQTEGETEIGGTIRYEYPQL